MEKLVFIKNKEFEHLPKTSGVYLLGAPKPKGEGGFEILYIGKAINLKNRVKNHFQQPSYRDNLFIDKIDKIGYIDTNSEIEALLLEAALIKKHQPKFNVVWRDDKNYFYVAIAQNKEKVPYVFITHQLHQDPKTKYIGPFVEGTALKKTLRFLRKAFPYYTAPKHSKNKCTYCHLDLCPGSRLFEARLDSPKGEAANLLKEYKNNIKKLTLILQGKKSAVLRSLRKEMKNASKENKFEEAAKLRDRIWALQHVMSHTHVISNGQNLLADKKPISGWEKTEQILQGLLNLREVSKIECYDISNIQGKNATGSMVVFVGGQPDKSQYKKFKIRMENTPNDIAMLKETLTRRFTHEEWKYPEVILIDGGIAQLNVAINAKDLDFKTRPIRVISIAKRNKELYIEGRKDPVLLKTLPREIYNLILSLDDEAHRFAITYHKKLRKNQLLSE